MENTAAARKATRERIGPWFVYQHRNPAAPGMKFETLLAFVRKGKVKARSIVRGPTSHQLWRFAAQVKGLSREFGVCYSCGGAIEATVNLCSHCNRLQEPPPNPNVLLESGESDPPRRAPAQPSAPIPAARPPASAKRGSGPFSGGAANENLPSIDDLLTDDEVAARPPARGSAPVASFRKQPAGDNFLSARELATAFNLGFNPASGSTGKTRRKIRWGRWMMLLVVLAAAAAAVIAWLNPVIHQRAGLWVGDTWKKIHPLFASKPSGAGSAEPHSRAADEKQVSKAPRESHALVTAATTASDSARIQPKPPLAAQLPAVGSTSTPNVGNPTVTDPDKDEKKTAAVQNNTVAAPTPTNPLPVKSPSQEQPGSAIADKPLADKPVADQGDAHAASADDSDKARALYIKGIDAEQQVDFAGAAKCYEQIMKLPREVWPTDVEVRLRLVRKQAGQK
jgi:outer membrane biosynthesis protein TonB